MSLILPWVKGSVTPDNKRNNLEVNFFNNKLWTSMAGWN